MRQTTQDLLLARLRELGRRWRAEQRQPVGGALVGAERGRAGASLAHTSQEEGARPSASADDRTTPQSDQAWQPTGVRAAELVGAIDTTFSDDGFTDAPAPSSARSPLAHSVTGATVDDGRGDPRARTPWGWLVALLAVVALSASAIAAYLAWPRAVSDVSREPSPGLASAAPAPGAAEAVPANPEAADPFAVPTVAAPSTIVVHVTGEVRRPGVVRIPAGSRVVDAVQAAGGLARGGSLGGVNLARVLSDGERVEVGASVPPEGAGAGPGPASGARPSGADPTAPLDLNTATAEQLDALPGIGPVTAAKILAWRSEHGRFTVVDELAEVSGIGPKTLEELRPHVRV